MCAHAFITHACLPLLSLCIGSVAHIKNTRVTQSEIESPNTTRSRTPSGEQPQVKVGQHHLKSHITFIMPDPGINHLCMGCENTLAGEKERCTSSTVFGMNTRALGHKNWREVHLDAVNNVHVIKNKNNQNQRTMFSRTHNRRNVYSIPKTHTRIQFPSPLPRDITPPMYIRKVRSNISPSTPLTWATPPHGRQSPTARAQHAVPQTKAQPPPVHVENTNHDGKNQMARL
ncbi:uncharacterized protein TM35_001181030, partial [Trypanosoma theileri]